MTIHYDLHVCASQYVLHIDKFRPLSLRKVYLYWEDIWVFFHHQQVQDNCTEKASPHDQFLPQETLRAETQNNETPTT